MIIMRTSNTKPVDGGFVARRIILAETDRDYVTWQQNPEQEGKPRYWGHYFPKRNPNAREDAQTDFYERLRENGFHEIQVQE